MTIATSASEMLHNQLQVYSQKRFTGRLDIKASIVWSLYFCQGRLVWAAGGEHPIRRWHRLLKQYCCPITAESIRLRETHLSRASWEYLALTVLVKRQAITGDQAVAAIKNNLTEVLFDIIQYGNKAPLNFVADPQDVLDASLTLVNPVQALLGANQMWETWRHSGFAKVSPNLAPILKKPEVLQDLSSPLIYYSLVQLIDGKNTFRDLADQVKQNFLMVMRSLVPYIRQGAIAPMRIRDLPAPATQVKKQTNPNLETDRRASQRKIKTLTPSPTPVPTQVTQPKYIRPLIAYVEDSLHECKIMADILAKARYGFISLADSVQALPLLLEHKPDCIFLDLVMPIANGYEICAQIRRVSHFKTTPIIILTGRDGLVDRVRAKMVGATDFLAKPIEEREVLATLMKHLDATPLPQENLSCLPAPAS